MTRHFMHIQASAPHRGPFDIAMVDAAVQEAVALCGGLVVDPKEQLTLAVEHVTCVDCAVRVIAELHRQQAVLLSTIAGVVVAHKRAEAAPSESMESVARRRRDFDK